MRLSPNFWMREALTTSKPHLQDEVTAEVLENIRRAAWFMESVRQACGSVPVNPTSWYRSRALNDAIGGASTSRHTIGLAVDFKVPGLDAAGIIAAMREEKLIKFCDQVIGYDPKMGGHVHLHLPTTSGRWRKQVLWKHANGRYLPF